MTTFQRARSEEQRDARRAAILDDRRRDAGRDAGGPARLNELARRVGLAKSNVLRYFESREAVLLELLDAAAGDWLADLEREPAPDGDAAARIEALAARRGAPRWRARPVLCDLVSAQAGGAGAQRLDRGGGPAQAGRDRAHPDPGRAGRPDRAGARTGAPRCELAGATMLTAGALWAHSCPSAAMLAAYEAEPELAAFRLDFADLLTELLAVLATGLVARGPGPPAAP